MATLVFEVGCEELPYSELTSLSEQLLQQLAKRLEAERLSYASIEPLLTPRRLGAVLAGVAERQSSATTERKGPALGQAFAADGQATAAAIGFARSCGVELSELEHSADGRLLCVQQLPELPAASVLAEVLPAAWQAIKPRKTMRWDASSTRFSRPVRWLLVLLDQQLIVCSIAGCSASNKTSSHRLINPGFFAIDSADAYFSRLAENGKVIANFNERSALIQQQVDDLARQQALVPDLSPQLLTIITSLVEYPQALLCCFPERFLQLPDKLLRSVLIEHQKYIPLNKADGQLSNYFIAVSNNPEGDSELIRQGHERVVRPRLEDALFFWNKDQQTGLEALTQRLDSLSFARGLGSMHAKAQRLEVLVKQLADDLGIAETELQAAARLAKADLLSNLVQEFPELQGYAGACLARSAGMSELLCSALAQQYQPAGRDDAVPGMPAALLALSDKLDTLAAMFSIGKKPSSSADPFGLRRAALGIIAIISEHKLPLNLAGLCLMAIKALDVAADKQAKVQQHLVDFLQERVRVLWVERGFSAELVRAVLKVVPLDINEQQLRLAALQDWSRDARGRQLLEIYKRINNICGQQQPQAAPAKAKLQAADELLEQAYQSVVGNWQSADTSARLLLLAQLYQPLADFFAEVMVMTEDLPLRQARLQLLSRIRELFDQIADFSTLQ